jgi:hypothetical protein
VKSKPICPFCERPVIATVKESGGENFGTTIVSYYHDGGEVHFRVNKPKDDLPTEDNEGIFLR